MNRKFLAALCGLVLTLGFVPGAYADNENSNSNDVGYNTSSGDTTTIGTDPNTGGEGAGDAQAMQNIQSDTQSMKERWSGSAQRDAVENGN